jgi:hypothetical protein
MQPKGLPRELDQPLEVESKSGDFNRQISQTIKIEASGKGSVATQNAQGATIITGNRNIIGSGNIVKKI